MIDETLRTLVAESLKDWLPVPYEEALTAIYEIGLGVIGKDGEVTGYERPGGLLSVDLTESYRNELRKEQRKAWAKACGVAEK